MRNDENTNMTQMDLPPTPSSSNNSSRANTPTQGESLADPGSETTSAVRRRVGKVYPPKPAAGKRDLLMAIDFHQISVQVPLRLLLNLRSNLYQSFYNFQIRETIENHSKSKAFEGILEDCIRKVINEVVTNRILAETEGQLMDQMLKFFRSRGEEIKVDWSSVVLQRVLEVLQPQWAAVEKSFKSLEEQIKSIAQPQQNHDSQR